MEERLARLDGAGNIRKWLMAISAVVYGHVALNGMTGLRSPCATGNDEEAGWGDVNTTQGYHRLVACEDVRNKAAMVYPDVQECKDFLQRMCDRRLVPTPWLNRVYIFMGALLSLESNPMPNTAMPPGQVSSLTNCSTLLPAAQDFLEPLYLLDKPVLIEDTRTQEQLEYPELFRHVLVLPG